MVVVMNHLHFSQPVDEMIAPLQQEGLPLLASQPGFQDFYFVKTAADRGTVIIIWQDVEAAASGAMVFGPTWFNQHIAPKLASEQVRSVGEVVVKYQPLSAAPGE